MRLDLIGRKDLPIAFGRWRLTELLGEGGMARVFRGELQGGAGFRKPAAVKVVLPGIGDKAALLRRQLLQEARVGALLNHPNIVQTFDCGELEGYPFIAMELVEGVGLQELVQGYGKLPPGVALDIAAQVAGGLHHAHTAVHQGRELRVIHRDVKPSNVLVRADGVAKVVDFGIAKAAIDDALSTSTGMTKGTPAYMSPEQLAADPLDARSDLFALGALLHYLLWGRTLFSGQSITEVMLRIIQVDETLKARGLFAEADALVPGLGDVLSRLLVKDPERRFPNGRVAAQAIDALRSRASAHPTTTALVTEYLRQRAAGAVFGVPSDEPGDAPRVVAPKLRDSDVTSGFRQKVEAAREAGVEWIEATEGGDGPGATRLVPAVPPAPAPAQGLSDLSLPEVPRRGGWVDHEPDENVGRTRAMASSRSVPTPKSRRKSGEARRSRARRRRMVMGALMFAVVAVGFAAWVALDRTGPSEVAALDEAASGDAIADAGGAVDPREPSTSGSRAAPRSRTVTAPPVRSRPAAAAAPEAKRELVVPAEEPVEEPEDGVADAAPEGAGAAGGPAEAGEPEADASSEDAPMDGELSEEDVAAEDAADDEGDLDEDAVADAEPEGEAARDEPRTRKALVEGVRDDEPAFTEKGGGEASGASMRTAPPRPPLRISHNPFTMATVGTSKKVRVYAAGVDDPKVVVHWAPKGGEAQVLPLARAGTGVWEGLLPITAEMRDAGGLVYWVVVTHPEATPKRLQSGTPDSPHEVVVY